MAIASLHSLDVPSTSFTATAKVLNAAAIVMRDPLSVSPERFISREAQIQALSEYLLRGYDEGEFSAGDLAYLKSVREVMENTSWPSENVTETESTIATETAGSGSSTPASGSASKRRTARKRG